MPNSLLLLDKNNVTIVLPWASVAWSLEQCRTEGGVITACIVIVLVIVDQQQGVTLKAIDCLRLRCSVGFFCRLISATF